MYLGTQVGSLGSDIGHIEDTKVNMGHILSYPTYPSTSAINSITISNRTSTKIKYVPIASSPIPLPPGLFPLPLLNFVVS